MLRREFGVWCFGGLEDSPIPSFIPVESRKVRPFLSFITSVSRVTFPQWTHVVSGYSRLVLSKVRRVLRLES